MGQTVIDNILIWTGAFVAVVVLLMLSVKLYMAYLKRRMKTCPPAHESFELEDVTLRYERCKHLYDRLILLSIAGSLIFLVTLTIKALSDSDDDSDHDSGVWDAIAYDSDVSGDRKKKKQNRKQNR